MPTFEPSNPELARPAPNVPEIWTPKRLDLLGWFQKNAPSLADPYRGAVTLLDDTEFPARLPLISHVMRDLLDRLPSVLELEKGDRVQYEGQLDVIAPLWPASIDSAMTQDAEFNIKYSLAQLVHRLVEDHRRMRQRPTAQVRLVQILAKRSGSQAAANMRLADDLKAVRRWFMERTHLRSRGEPLADEKELRAAFSRFEGILHSFVGSVFVGNVEIDAILQQANQ